MCINLEIVSYLLGLLYPWTTNPISLYQVFYEDDKPCLDFQVASVLLSHHFTSSNQRSFTSGYHRYRIFGEELPWS